MVFASWRCIIKTGGEVHLSWVAFTSDGTQDEESDVQSGKANAVIRALQHLVVLKQEPSRKTKLSMCKLIFVPILTYGHES